jgi:hypothetical protein
MKPTITKKVFLEWYFDFDTKKSIGFCLVNELILNGTVTKTVENIYNNCCYIPANLCENLAEEQKQNDNLEFEPFEITLID